MKKFRELTLLEMMIALTVFGVLTSSVFTAWFLTQRTFSYSTVKSKLEQKARQILLRISEDLIQSGNPTAGTFPDGSEDGFVNDVNITSAGLDTLIESDLKYNDYENAIGTVGINLNMEKGILFCKKRSDSVFIENLDPFYPTQHRASLSGWSRPVIYYLDKKTTPDNRRGQFWKLTPVYKVGTDNEYTIRKELILGSGIAGYMRMDDVNFTVNPLGQIEISITLVQDFFDTPTKDIRVTLQTTVSPRN